MHVYGVRSCDVIISKNLLRPSRDLSVTDGPLDFSRKVPIRNHCIAARITAENPEDGFLPNSGTITKVGGLNFAFYCASKFVLGRISNPISSVLGGNGSKLLILG